MSLCGADSHGDEASLQGRFTVVRRVCAGPISTAARRVCAGPIRMAERQVCAGPSATDLTSESRSESSTGTAMATRTSTALMASLWMESEMTVGWIPWKMNCLCFRISRERDSRKGGRGKVNRNSERGRERERMKKENK